MNKKKEEEKGNMENIPELEREKGKKKKIMP